MNMNIQQIQEAIESGKNVFWASRKYAVIKEETGQFKIKYTWNDKTTDLVKRDGVTLTCSSDKFFIEE